MAAPPRTGRLFQDTNAYAPRKVSGRKPLSDVSNNAGNKPLDASAKPSVSVTRPSKQIIKSNLDNNNNNNNISVIMNDGAVFVSSSAKAKNLESSNIRTANNTASGKSKTGGGGSRKVLSDISNTGKLPLLEIKEKKTLKSLREEEPLFPSAIGEEMCRHDHRRCVEAQSKALDFRFIMNDCFRDLKVSAEPPLNIKIESESEHWESDEEPELSIPEGQSRMWHWSGISSPEHCNNEEHLELPSSPVNFEIAKSLVTKRKVGTPKDKGAFEEELSC
ncbi:uncharacterized protein [Arachis hypogaea]|uniref:uncharacterized protein n=1 Tax=Arachis hypogaea TaxID=3818 RepID=UPI000DEC7502|nr:uncharacterized protein LOC112702832 [Arachis hypogaea]QHO27966.1 uncharacterized protein DS421_7g212530 [Arachis hypogaea]